MTKDELLELVRKDARPMTNGEKLRLVILLSMPAMLAQVSSVFMQIIDASMLGHLSTGEAASVSLVSTTIWLFGGLLSAFAAGFSVQVAHRVGARDYKGSRSVIRQGIISCLAFSLLLLTIAVCIAPHLPHWLGADEELCYRSTEYFTIFAMSMPVVILNGLFAGSLRCSGNIKTPSMLLVMLCFLDVIFNYVFIFLCDMSTAGAAYGTVASYVVCLMGMTYALVVKDSKLRFSLDHDLNPVNSVNSLNSTSYRPTAKIIRKALRIGAPIGMERGVMCTAQVAISSIIAPLGPAAIAANGFGINIESLCYMPGYGVAEAATTLVGQSKGAERRELMHSFAWISMALGVGIMTIMGAIMWIFAPEMISVITPDAKVIELGTEILRIEAWCEPGFAAAIVAYSVFVGAGKTLIPSLMNLASIWGIRFTLTLLLAPVYGLHGVWMAMAAELMVRGIMFTIRLTTRGWSFIKER